MFEMKYMLANLFPVSALCTMYTSLHYYFLYKTALNTKIMISAGKFKD